MAAPEKMVNVRVIEGGPLHIELAIPNKDPDAKGSTRKMLVLPGMQDPAGMRGVNVPESEWALAKAKPMVKGMLDKGTLIASA